MTTITSAATGRSRASAGFAAILILGSAGLAGCTQNPNFLNLSTNQVAPATASSAASQSESSSRARLALAPVIGAPESVASQLSKQLGSALEAERVSIAPATAGATPKADYTVRGYIVAARERAGTKVSYIWDVTDPQGQRVKRLTGEQVIEGATARDPWASVSAPVIDQIAKRTASDIVKWLPEKKPAEPPKPTPVASAATATQSTATRTTASTTTASTPATQPTRVAGSTTRTTTGSLPRNNSLLVVSPRVTGAPGDGSTSLARALSKELTSNGVALTNSPSGRAHRVNGKVAVGNANGGRQPIQIDWTVVDPNGRNLGTVSQKNEIPAGSLNGAWGQTADAAAGAAAQGILRLLRQNAATN